MLAESLTPGQNSIPATSFSLLPEIHMILLSPRQFLPAVLLLAFVPIPDLTAADAKDSAAADPAEGHSSHGEVFNEGPRQAAYLMDGLGTTTFDVTSSSDEAKAFVRQGVAQLHGFWYFESERSFRQAAMLDPDCAIAYWGMAMSNRKSEARAKGFIKEAMDRKDKTSRRERLYIEAFHEYSEAKSESTEDKTKRSEKYVSKLDDLVIEFPADLEAKAFLCEFLWSARRDGNKQASYLAVDALIQDILDREPLHSVHHYRIHLWDTKKSELALESAARCGLAAPSIAHMWHMPGHIYSRLKRYHDAVYQQEASARVDHAHMMKDQVLPDQIHNFAHNNEWCIRNMVHIGRVGDAIDLAQNMIQMPRHPKYNDIDKSGSYKYGRERLMDVLRIFELHAEFVRLCETPYLEKSGDKNEDLKRDRYLAAALVATGQLDKAMEIRLQLQTNLDTKKAERTAAGDKAAQTAQKEKKNDKDVEKARKAAEATLLGDVKGHEKAIDEIDGRIAANSGKIDEALALFKKSTGVPVEEQVAIMLKAGKVDDAIKKIADHVQTNKNETRPLAAQVETLWAANKKPEAKKAFEELRNQSSEIDLSTPAFSRLTPIAKELGWEENWTTSRQFPADIGARPPLDALGPLRWQPVAAAEWSLADVQNQQRSLTEFRGKPVVAVFYLGAGCLHCAQQLQKFAPKAEAFKAAGFEIVAISTDAQPVLGDAYKDLKEGFPFPLVSDAELNVFKSYRCYDDFEKQPLHGTFVIDADGLIRWQDISYEPFMDPDFVLKEAKRLLQQDQS